jgi:5-methylcytosine-specific restriction endonuclease McrA
MCADKYIEYGKKQSLEYKREKTKRSKEKKISLGICSNCGKFPIAELSRVFCIKCLMKARENNKERYYKDPKKHHRYVRTWLQKNLDKLSTYQKRYADSHKTKIKIKNHHRRERVRNLEGTFTSQEWEVLCNRYDNRCLRCGERRELSVDHVIPIVKGGTGYINNIQPLCRSCNSKKGKRIIDFRPFGSAILEWT